MKIITQFILGIIISMPMAAPAQNLAGMAGSKGLEESKKGGVMYKLMRWQQFGSRHNSQVYDPQAKLMAQMGIRQQDNVTMASPPSDYDFYGGASYKGNNVPMASITDDDGNTYITGGSTNETQPAADFFTMKVSAAGTILWQARKPAAKYAVEYGMKLIFDKDGNIIVTGLKWNGNDMDIMTVKYSPAGVEIWSAIFNSTHQGIDIPSAIVAGTDGSIYITGISWSGNSVDYLTLKYDTAGNPGWQARNNGVGASSWNEPTAIALDSAGNVIITGYSSDAEGWLDYHTIKYNNQGQELWAQRYNYESTDPDNIAEVTNSTPRAIAVDNADNVYVTGTFDTFLCRIGTIKYNALGQQQWIHTYKSGTELTLGSQAAVKNGMLYVAGLRVGGFANDGNVLISYGLDGTQNWLQETTDLIEAVNAELLFDNAGNPVVAAKGMTPGAEEWLQDTAARAKKYSPAGVLLGQAAFVISSSEGLASMGDMAGAGLDENGNVYLSVNSFYSSEGAVFEIFKSGFGALSPDAEWTAKYANLGSPGASMLYSFADSSGNTFSTGSYYTFSDGMLNPNYFLVKHTAGGGVAWQSVYNAENSNPAGGIIGRADADGNLYVCLLPEFEGPLTIKKLSPAGTEVWEYEASLFNPQVYVMEPGPGGTLYLAGTALQEETAETPSFVGIKISASGTEVWRAFMESPNAEDTIYAANAGKVTPAGDLFLTGACGSGNFMSQELDLAVVKINNDGTAGWVTTIPVTGSVASGTDVLIADDGAVYTNGFSKSNVDGQEDIITAKINADGSTGWVQSFGEPGRDERSYTLKQFSTGDIAVIGYSLALNGDIHNTLIKYDAEGNMLWDYASENMRYYNDFHIDGADVCYIMDQAIVDPFPHKIFNQPFPIASLIKVDEEGNGEEEFFVGQEYAEFYGKQLIPHADDRLLLGGSIANQGFYEGLYFFETVHDGALGIPENEAEKQTNRLGQNYPNPAAGSTDIPFTLIEGGKASIKLYSSDGRLIKEVVNQEFSQGTHTVRFEASGLAPGIYLYQLKSGKFTQARKMLIK